MAVLTLDLRVADADGSLVVDPSVFIRLSTPDGVRASAARIALGGERLRVRFEDGPPGAALILRLTPSRYRDGAIVCRVDGDGTVIPTGDIRLPRRPSEWDPSFTPWGVLPDVFAPLQAVLAESPAFRVGRNSSPERFAEARYDAIDSADESRVLAKTSLLNLYSRLRQEPIPGRDTPWFAAVLELLLATRERFIAEVDEDCWATVRDLAKTPRDGYRKTPVGDHVANLRSIPGVAQLTALASVKTREAKANLQLTVGRAVRDGRPVFLLDTDLDENGRLLLHAFDLIKHVFTGGTHPIDIHESLRATFGDLVLGYQLVPRTPVAETRVRVVAGVAAEPPPAARVTIDIPATPQRIAVLGDSVPWGQGLLNAQKMHTLIGDVLGAAGAVPSVQVVAHSGATIGVGVTRRRQPVDPEVPRAHPTILQQCADFPVEEGAAIDLVILNGGINDVDIRFILNPFTEPEDLEDTTLHACGSDLLVLLRAAGERFPDARIAVLEYYPILSPQSRFSGGFEFLVAAGAPLPPMLMVTPATARTSLWGRIVDNCRIFHVTSSQAIRAAVAAANVEFPGGRFAAIDAGFGDENAALAREAWLFAVNWDLTPQDPVAVQRRQACTLFEPDLIRREQCFRASAGHPNARGAQAYARAIVAALAGLTV
jgi:lysophospholipase L1-like esterase